MSWRDVLDALAEAPAVRLVITLLGGCLVMLQLLAAWVLHPLRTRRRRREDERRARTARRVLRTLGDCEHYQPQWRR